MGSGNVSTGYFWLSAVALGFLGITATAGITGSIILEYHGIATPPFLAAIINSAVLTIGGVVFSMRGNGNGGPVSAPPGSSPSLPAVKQLP